MAEKRILIVGADGKAWDEFRRALGQSWTVAGAATGAAAMTEALIEPFDVIVAHSELADTDEFELLNKFRIGFPKTLRFIAAAEAMRTQVAGQLLGGHKFLSLPIDPATTKTLIESSLSEDFGMSQSMRELVGRIRTFPTIPSLYLEVVGALKNPNASTEDIGMIIGQDMAMTTKLVQVLNSAYYGLPRTITDPTEAVGLLGFDTVKSLIMTVKLLSQYDKVKPVYFSIDTVWRHSTNVAHTAKALARMETSDTEITAHAYTAGLMHDLGKVILAANFDAQYQQAHVTAVKEQRPLWEVEKEILGASHGEIGAYLLGLWGMPSQVVKVAAFHHQPQRAGDASFTVLTAVHVANALEYEVQPAVDGLVGPVVDNEYVRQLGLESRVEAWRRRRHNPEDTKFETKMQRAKAAARSAAKAPVNAAATETAAAPAPTPIPISISTRTTEPVPVPALRPTPFTPGAPPSSPPQWRARTKWLAFGLAASAALAFSARFEALRLATLAEEPEVLELAGEPAIPVKHIIPPAVAPPTTITETKPDRLPPMAVQPAPKPAFPAAAGPVAPVPVKNALDTLKLKAIFFNDQHPSALINDQLAVVNQEVGECRVLDITRSSVTVEFQHQRKTLSIP